MTASDPAMPPVATELTDPPVGTPDPQPEAEAPAIGEASLLRDLIARAYPDTVPELIQGDTLADLLASIPAARAAWERIAEAAAATASAPAPVPAGNPTRSTQIDTASLSPFAKIRHALARE